MPVLALPPSLVERLERRGWAIALVPVLFALLTSTDLAPFFAATWIFAPEVMAVVALPLLLLLLVRHVGRASVGSLQHTLVARIGRYRSKIATAAGLASLAALVTGSIDLGGLGALVTALASVGDLGIWLWVLAAGIPEIAIIAAVLIAVVLLVRTIFRFAVRLVCQRGDTR
jgi:hypothetical protein